MPARPGAGIACPGERFTDRPGCSAKPLRTLAAALQRRRGGWDTCRRRDLPNGAGPGVVSLNPGAGNALPPAHRPLNEPRARVSTGQDALMVPSPVGKRWFFYSRGLLWTLARSVSRVTGISAAVEVGVCRQVVWVCGGVPPCAGRVSPGCPPGPRGLSGALLPFCFHPYRPAVVDVGRGGISHQGISRGLEEAVAVVVLQAGPAGAAPFPGAADRIRGADGAGGLPARRRSPGRAGGRGGRPPPAARPSGGER